MPKDNTKYVFNGIDYSKRRLALAVVKQYVNDFSPSLSELKNKFPRGLQSRLDVIVSSDELVEKNKNSNDTKNRYFIKGDDTLITSDGETVLVTSEWRSGNINRFIDNAKSLGFEIKVVENMTKTIKELYEEYKNKPRNDWIENYKARSNQLLSYKDKSVENYDLSLLKDIWETPANGIANASPGFMSKLEFENLLDELPDITSKIVQNPSSEILNEVMAWADRAKRDGKFKTVKRGVINRVFSAANPKVYSSIINKKLIIKLIDKLNEIYDFDISTEGNWAELNIGLMNKIRSQGLEDEDVFIVNTFVWSLYVSLVENKMDNNELSNDEDSENLEDNNSCVNIIYYGPPGTGKTYKLQKLLKENYTENGVFQDRTLWLNAYLEELSWYEILILILLESNSPMKVADITSHEYYQIKAKLNDRGANLRATAWSALQSHAIPDSTTVNYSSRREPMVFDKTNNSTWFIVDSQKDQLDEYKGLLALLLAGPEQSATIKRYEFVTFHQSYGYEEFIEGLRPVTNSDGDISYEVKPGVFKRICKHAEADPDNQFAIVIDEINRGNISKIFGELITLVETDKRAGSENELTLTLPYSGAPFSVPSNVDIIGTMNTADRSLTHIDVALRRRFDFKELRTDYSLLSDNIDGINLRRMLFAMNQRIELLLDREHILGHALLMKVTSVGALEHVFKTSIMPLLEEYFFENWDKINQVLNCNGFIEEQKGAYAIWLVTADDYATKSYRVNSLALKEPEGYKRIYSYVESSAFVEIETVLDNT